MKLQQSLPSLVVFAALSFTSLSGQSAPKQILPADQAWAALQLPRGMQPLPKERPADMAEMKALLAARAAAFVATADQAKDFYTQYSGDAKAADARLLEVRSLVSAVQTGDATVEGRLAESVQALRDDKSLPAAVKVQAVSAYGFCMQMRGKKTHEERLKAIEAVARGLTAEFPDQPQGYESLLTVAATSPDEAAAKKIARELLTRPTPASVKEGAQTMMDRFALVGKPLAKELDGANEGSAKSKLRANKPTIVYSWASGSPGSLALAADIKKSGIDANIIALNLDTDATAAAAIAQKEGLVGNLIYDVRGREGALAQRLRIKIPSQVFLIDSKGVIRDVKGEWDLKNKLKQVGQ